MLITRTERFIRNNISVFDFSGRQINLFLWIRSNRNLYLTEGVLKSPQEDNTMLPKHNILPTQDLNMWFMDRDFLLVNFFQVKVYVEHLLFSQWNMVKLGFFFVMQQHLRPKWCLLSQPNACCNKTCFKDTPIDNGNLVSTSFVLIYLDR